MERRKFTTAITALVTGLFVGKSSSLNGQIVQSASKSVEDINPHTNEKEIFSLARGIKDSQVDGIIYRKISGQIFKKDYSGYIDVRWFGAKGDGVTDDTDAFNKALTTIEKKAVYVPSTPNGYLINSTITIPNNKSLIGDGKGNGENTRTKILFAGSGVLFDVHSYYVTIRDLHIISTTNNTVDNTAFYISVTQTILENVTIDGFRVGVRNTFTKTTFAHFFKNVMITGCTTGVDLETANNISFEGCFFDSNSVCVRLNNVTQASFSNGTVLQTAGNLKTTGFRRAENSNSILLEILSSRAITVRDCYFEIAAGSTTAINQKIASLTSVSGFNFTGNYCICSYRQDQPPLFDIADDKCLAISIYGNTFWRAGANTLVLGASGAGVGKQYGVNIHSNRLSANASEMDNSFIPYLKVGKDASSSRLTTQIGYCSLNNDTVNISGIIALAGKPNGETGPLSIGGLPLPMKKGLNPRVSFIGNLMIKNMANVKPGKYIEIFSGNSFADLKDENGNPILVQDLAANAVINFSISYPYSQNTLSGV